jgi:hypothetical protein
MFLVGVVLKNKWLSDFPPMYDDYFFVDMFNYLSNVANDKTEERRSL